MYLLKLRMPLWKLLKRTKRLRCSFRWIVILLSIRSEIDASALWDTIIDCATTTAEPGPFNVGHYHQEPTRSTSIRISRLRPLTRAEKFRFRPMIRCRLIVFEFKKSRQKILLKKMQTLTLIN